MVIGIIHSTINKLGICMLYELELALTFIITLIVAYIVNRYYEIPVSKYLKTKLT